MISQLYFYVGVMVVLFAGLSDNADEVKITHNFPEEITVSKPVAVQFKIENTGISGFAELAFDLPSGITLTAAEENQSSSENNSVRFPFADFSRINNSPLNLILTASDNTPGVKKITGTFSFIRDNEKVTMSLEPVHILVTAGSFQQSQPVRAERIITEAGAGNEKLVTIKIFKSNTKGFARFSDDLPEGTSARAVETDGSSFSVADGKLKFVWVNAPEKEDLQISYALSTSKKKSITLRGEYSFLEENQTRKFVLPEENLDFEIEATSAPAAKKTSPARKTQPVTKKAEARAETDITYHVQVGAFSGKKTNPAAFAKKFKLEDDIRTHMHGGYSKFMVGSHSEYKLARDQRDLIKDKNGIRSAFVVAYNQGKRITVQEALMITNQKWFK